MAKTDKIDARLIAQFGVKKQPGIRPIPGKNIRRVRDLLARKRQLNETRTQELHRQHQSLKVLEASHKRLLKFLDKEVAWVNARLEKEVLEISEWKSTDQNRAFYGDALSNTTQPGHAGVLPIARSTR